MAIDVTNKPNWTCSAPIPNIKTNRRAPCGYVNKHTDNKCRECGAPRNFTTTDKTISKDNTMSTVKPASNTAKSTPATVAAAQKAAEPTKPVAPVAATTDAAPAKVKDPASKRIKLVSTRKDVDYYVRVRPDLFEKHGAPRDPWGEVMIAAAPGAAPTSKKAAKIEAKEAETKLLAGMNDEQKVAYAKAKREKAAATKDAQRAERKAKMMAELKKELEDSGMAIVPKVAQA